MKTGDIIIVNQCILETVNMIVSDKNQDAWERNIKQSTEREFNSVEAWWKDTHVDMVEKWMDSLIQTAVM